AWDRGAREKQLDDVATARRHDVVEAHRGEVGAPHASPLEADAGIGGAQAVKEGTRAKREVQAEEGQREHQRAPMDGRQIREELADRVEEDAQAVADRGRGERSGHVLKRTDLGRAESAAAIQTAAWQATARRRD